MKGKRLFVGIALVLALVMSVGVMEASAQKKFVIGASMVQKDSDWWAMMARLLEQAAKAKGYDIVTVWANADQEKQIKDVEDLIQRKVDIIIMGPVQQDGSMVAIDQAHKADEFIAIPECLSSRVPEKSIWRRWKRDLSGRLLNRVAS